MSDLHVYSRAQQPVWSGRPHGQGSHHKAAGGYGLPSDLGTDDQAARGYATGGSGIGDGGAGPWGTGVWRADATRASALEGQAPDLAESTRGVFVYAGVVTGEGFKG